MFPASFDYLRADSVAQALSLLAQNPEAKLLAGGHSLVPMLKLRLAQPSLLVDISRISELRGICLDGQRLSVGALTTHHAVETSELVRHHVPILAEAAGHIGDHQVRNRGTVGGNIAHADPASDLPAVLVALDATIRVLGQNGERGVPAREFFVGLLATALAEGEIVKTVEIPILGAGDGSAYLKQEHPASGYAVCGAAAVLRGGRFALAFNGVAEKALLVDQVVAALGTDHTDAAIDAAVEAHLKVDDPLSDLHASAQYRVHLAKVFGKRALKLARDRAR